MLPTAQQLREVTAAQLRDILAHRSVDLLLQLEKFTPDVQLSMPIDGKGVRLRVSVAPGEEGKIPKSLDVSCNGGAVRIPLEVRPDLEAYEPLHVMSVASTGRGG